MPKDILVVQRINTALAMVQAGFGVTVCPVYASELAAGFGLKLVKLGRPELQRDYAILIRAGHSLAPAVEAFRVFLLAFRAEVGEEHQFHQTLGAGIAPPAIPQCC